jgi:hypothetical protein
MSELNNILLCDTLEMSALARGLSLEFFFILLLETSLKKYTCIYHSSWSKNYYNGTVRNGHEMYLLPSHVILVNFLPLLFYIFSVISDVRRYRKFITNAMKNCSFPQIYEYDQLSQVSVQHK